MLPSLWLPPKECDQQPRSAVPPLEIDYGGYPEYPGSLASSSPPASPYGAPRNRNVLADFSYPAYPGSHSPCSGRDHVYKPSDPLFHCSNDCAGGFYNNLRTDLHVADLNRTYNATITFQHAKRKRTLSMSSLDTQASKKSCSSSVSSGDSESSFSTDTEMRFIKIEDVSPLPASDQLSIPSYSPPQLYTKSPDNLPLNIVPLNAVSRARFVTSPSVFPSPYDYSRHTASLKYHSLDPEPLNLTKTKNKEFNGLAPLLKPQSGCELTMDLRVRKTEVPDVAANFKVHTHTSDTRLVQNGPSEIANREQDFIPSSEIVENSECLRTCNTSAADENNPSEDNNLRGTSNNSEQIEDSVRHDSLEYLCLQEFFQNWKEESPSATVIDTDSFDTASVADSQMHDPLDSSAGNQNQKNPNAENPLYTNPTSLISTDSEVPVCGPYSSSTSLPVVPILANVNERKEGDTSAEGTNHETVPASIPSSLVNTEDGDIDDPMKNQKDTASSKHEYTPECLDIESAPPKLVLETLNIIKDVITEAVDTVEIQNELQPQSIDVELAPFTSIFKTIHIIEDAGTVVEASDTGDKESPSLICHSVAMHEKSVVLPSMPLLGGEPELPPITEEELNEIDVGTPEQDDSSNAVEPTTQTDTPRTENNLSGNENEKMEQEGPEEDSKTDTDQANGVSDMIKKLKTPTLPRNATMNFFRFFGSDETALDEFLQRPGVVAQCGNPIRSMTPTPKTPSRIKSRRRHSEGAEMDSLFTPRLLRSHQKKAQNCQDTIETPKSSTRSTRRNTVSPDAQGPQSPTTFNDESNSSNPPKSRSQSPHHSPCVSTGSKTPGNARAKSKQPRQRKVPAKKGKKKTQLAVPVPESFPIAEDANSESELDAASLYVKREREKMLLHDSWLEQRRLLYAAYLPDVPLQGSENMHPVVLLERDAKLDALAKSLTPQSSD